MGSIHFFNEDLSFKLSNKIRLKKWISLIVSNEGYAIECINFIFCSNNYLLKINQNYLQHDYFTDIITFDNSVELGVLMADLYISIPMVKENAKNYETTFENELHRVMIHGIWHLMGYGDKSKSEKEIMRQKEDQSLLLLKF